jgi:hypothetical protein
MGKVPTGVSWKVFCYMDQVMAGGQEETVDGW